MSSESQKVLIPGSFRIESATLSNFSGEEINIRPMITELTVMESMHSMFCVYEFLIVDGVALLEKYAITGNEKIKLEITKKDDPDADDVVTTKYLTVTGINEYGRIINESQAYMLQAVTETAMHCSIERVSKAVNGTAAGILADLYNEVQYKLPLDQRDTSTEGNYKLVLPNYTYTDTLAMLLGKAQNSSGSTFHMFESLWGDMSFTSYDEIIKSDPIDEYRIGSFQSTEGLKLTEFDKIRKKIKSINSNLGISHFEAFKKGGLSSRVFMNDIATKTFEKKDYFVLDEDLGRMDNDYALAPQYKVGKKPVSEIKQAKTFMVNKNTMAFANADNGQNRVDESVAKKRFRYENQFAVSHNIVVVGDSRLRAGSTIDIYVPTATDPKYISDVRDDYFSGRYFISSVRHSLKMGGSYTVDLTIRKDSVNRDKMISKNKSMK